MDPVERTCIIDGSAQRASWLDYQVITYGIRRIGDRLLDEPEDLALFMRAKRDADELVSDLSADDCEMLSILADCMVQDLSERLYRYFTIEDNSLYSEPFDGDDLEGELY